MYHVAQLAHDAITTSLLRQNDVATWCWRNNDVIIASCARGVVWDLRYEQVARIRHRTKAILVTVFCNVFNHCQFEYEECFGECTYVGSIRFYCHY